VGVSERNLTPCECGMVGGEVQKPTQHLKQAGGGSLITIKGGPLTKVRRYQKLISKKKKTDHGGRVRGGEGVGGTIDMVVAGVAVV